MKRTVLVVDDEQNMQTVMRMGEAEFSPMHLTFAARAQLGFVAPVRRREHTLSMFAKAPPHRPAERPAMDGRAGIIRSRDAAPGTAGKGE